MYEEGNKHLSLNWGSLIIKLVILAIIVFAAGWIYIKITNKSGASNKTTIADNNSEYINNIATMKNAAIEYFTESKLPEKVGSSEKVTLGQMINQKLIIDFTDDGKTCDTTSSYAQATKTADGNYALKVSLTCGKESDFIVTTIEKKECSNNSCSNTNTEDTNRNETTETKSNTNTNTSSNTSSSSNNSNSSNNASSSSKTTTTTTTTTKITIKVKCINGCCQTDCNNNTTGTKVRYYKYMKYSDWEIGYSTDSNAENKQQTVKTYNYCKKYNKTFYTTSYVTNKKTSGSYSYKIQFTDLPSDVNNVTLNSSSYFSNSTSDYQEYINSRGNLYMTGNTGKNNLVITDANSFKNSSLKSNNFTFSVGNVTKESNTWYTTINVNYTNLNGVTPYCVTSSGYYTYLVPIKFNISYTTECKRDLESNKNKYANYLATDEKNENIWFHRTKEYVWSKETSLSGYTYTGEYEDRTV